MHSHSPASLLVREVADDRLSHGERTFAAGLMLVVGGGLYERLIMPPGWDTSPERYPLDRAIATLKRLRDTYLSTGQVGVDWGPEIEAEPKQAWTAPQVAEVINPALPAELTSLLRNTVEA